jgi:hypothetical protein
MIELEEVLKAKKITPEQFDMYMHYQVNELGRKLLHQGMMTTFMDEVPVMGMTGEQLAFNEGRRSIFRDVYVAIDIVQKAIKESLHDGDN